MPEIVHWNPRRWTRVPLVQKSLPLPWRVNNFGDLVGPWLVDRILAREGISQTRRSSTRVMTVGSILELARPGDVVWGTGLKSAGDAGALRGSTLDIRAVRGPLTAEALEREGVAVPRVFGDPALLIPHVWTDAELGIVRRSTGVILVPHWRDRFSWPRDSLNPLGNAQERVRTLASAELVITGSLHGAIVAEAFGVPTVLVQPATESSDFKYRDYYEGTRRSFPGFARDVAAALDRTPAPPITEPIGAALLAAFPLDLWSPSNS